MCCTSLVPIHQLGPSCSRTKNRLCKHFCVFLVECAKLCVYREMFYYSLETTIANHNGTDVGVDIRRFDPNPGSLSVIKTLDWSQNV